MTDIAKTVSGGIQEVSALLPLLGTEQCEEHTGSALSGGFFYVSITPISVFGSLGIVKAGFNVLISSLSFPSVRFLGAEKLAYGGFKPKGEVAPMIAFDPKNPHRFLAESQLEALLEDEHIENAEDLTVEWDDGSLRWNFSMIALTVFCASVGISPYLYIILKLKSDENRDVLFLNGWPFPIIRLVGSALTGIVIQIIIQIRILIIIKTRLVFIAVDNLANNLGLDLSQVRPWNTKNASETCLWELRRQLEIALNAGNSLIRSKEEAEKVEDGTSETDEGASEKEHSSVNFHDTDKLDLLKTCLNADMKKHFPPGSRLTRFIQSRTYFILPVTLAGGLVLSVAGYIGSFNLVQNAPNDSTGPVLWLGLEVILCLLRIVVWAANPSWDDSKGMTFELKRVSHSPLVTCDIYGDELESTGTAPVVRANSFLDEVAAFTGPIPSFTWEDTALYYILTGKKSPDHHSESHDQSKVLYVVVSDYKEQTSRLLVKRDSGRGNFEIYVSSLVPDPRSTLVSVKTKFKAASAKVKGHDSTERRTHFLTSNERFMAALSNHYDDIINRICDHEQGVVDQKPFFKTWALKATDAESDEDTVPEAKAPLMTTSSEFNLTPEDVRYLEQGQLDRRWDSNHIRMAEWIDLYMQLITRELLEDVPTNLQFKKDESVTFVQKHEANEVEFLLIEARAKLETFLRKTSAAWEEMYVKKSNSMTEEVVRGTFISDDIQTPVVEANGKLPIRADDKNEPLALKVRRTRLSERLKDEKRRCIEHHLKMENESMHRRVDSQAEEVRKRMQGRKYNDPESENIMKAWEECLKLGDRWSEHVRRSEMDVDDVIEQYSGENVRNEQSRDSHGEPGDGHDGQKQDFRQLLEKRFEKAYEEIRKINDGDEEGRKFKRRWNFRLEKMVQRCRQRVTQLMRRLETQALEFRDEEDESFLTDLSSNWENQRAYWSAGANRERIRLLDRRQKFLKVSSGIAELVTFENVCRALKRSGEFQVIDFTDFPIEGGYAEQVADVVREVKTITGLTTRQELFPPIREALQANISAISQTTDVCSYEEVVITDYYRRDEPYLLFPAVGYSRCIVLFRVQDIEDHILTLRHCVTTSKGRVDITLNGTRLEQTWGIEYPVMANFQNEDIKLPRANLKAAPELNKLEIRLASDSEGVYWLSDVFLPARKASEPKLDESEMAELISES